MLNIGAGTSARNQGNKILSMSLLLRDSWSIGWTILLKIKGIFMIFVLQTLRTLTTNFKEWIHVFRPLMNRLKLFKTNFMGRKEDCF